VITIPQRHVQKDNLPWQNAVLPLPSHLYSVTTLPSPSDENYKMIKRWLSNHDNCCIQESLELTPGKRATAVIVCIYEDLFCHLTVV